MKFLLRLLIGIVLIFVVVPIGLLSYLGLMPGISSLLGFDKPKDLGVKYSQEDLTKVREKSQIKYEALPFDTPPEQSLQRTGSREINTNFSSAEITASMNNQKWRYWPYSNVQVKFNGDGSGEISGILLKDKVPGYGAAIGIPKEALAFVMKYLPTNPVFYVKGRAALADNKVNVFEPQNLEIGRMPIPVGIFISAKKGFIRETLAIDMEMISQLSKIKNKEDLIKSYINSRLNSIEGFYAKSAKFTENNLIFEGKLNTRIATSQ